MGFEGRLAGWSAAHGATVTCYGLTVAARGLMFMNDHLLESSAALSYRPT